MRRSMLRQLRCHLALRALCAWTTSRWVGAVFGGRGGGCSERGWLGLAGLSQSTAGRSYPTTATTATTPTATHAHTCMPPPLQGNRTPHTDALSRGAITGLTLAHGRGHVFRALLESICFGTEHIFETMRAAGFTPTSVTLAGGATRSDLWMQVAGAPEEVVEEVVGGEVEEHGRVAQACC